MTPTPLSPSDLHAAIMNVRGEPEADWTQSERHCYKIGHRDARHAAAELALSVVNQVVQEPPGMVLVPREPTPHMLFMAADVDGQSSKMSRAIWRAMIEAASPQPVPVQEPVARLVIEGHSRDLQPWHGTLDGVRALEALPNGAPLYAQPVRGEALPAEQPKSDEANLVVAVGSDLPPALPADHAEYMAQFGEHLISAVTALVEIYKLMADGEGPDPQDVRKAESEVTEVMVSLRSAIGEFRNRLETAANAERGA